MQRYEPEFKQKILRLHLEEGRTLYLHFYHSDEELDRAVSDLTHCWYNHVRPHSYNGYLTPFEARYQIRKY